MSFVVGYLGQMNKLNIIGLGPIIVLKKSRHPFWNLARFNLFPILYDMLKSVIYRLILQIVVPQKNR